MANLDEVNWKRENVWLRMLLMGPSGAGKTMGALEVATKLFGGSLDVVGLDTEHGRMKLYADRYPLKAYAQLNEDHSPETWTDALDWAYGKAPGGVAVLDSFSHEWMGKNGVLQQVDRFADWAVVRPKHSDLIEHIAALPMHVIVCVRSKMKYQVTEEEADGRMRQRIQKLGLGPIQDDAIIYEFDVVGAVDVGTHETTFSNRCEPLVDQTFELAPGDEVAGILSKWLSEGDPPALPEAASDDAVTELMTSLAAEGFAQAVIEEKFAQARQGAQGVLTAEYVERNLAGSKERLAAKAKAKPEPKAEVPA